jgi:ADP-heptose:LPS heptosyltransferase
VLKDKQAGWRGTVALLRQLRSTCYDLVVDLRTDGLTLLLHARHRLTRRGSQPLGYHAVERHFGAISRYIGTTHIPAAKIWLAQGELSFTDQHLSGLPGQRWLALAPGARWQPKCWPAQRFHALVKRLQAGFDAVILLGDATEVAVCQEINEQLPLPAINLAGNTDLLQAAAVLARSRLFVGNDSGLGHIAAATGTPTVTVFGPGDPARYHPWHPQARWIQSSTGNIEGVTVNAVTDEVMAVLGT